MVKIGFFLKGSLCSGSFSGKNVSGNVQCLSFGSDPAAEAVPFCATTVSKKKGKKQPGSFPVVLHWGHNSFSALVTLTGSLVSQSFEAGISRTFHTKKPTVQKGKRTLNLKKDSTA